MSPPWLTDLQCRILRDLADVRADLRKRGSSEETKVSQAEWEVDYPSLPTDAISVALRKLSDHGYAEQDSGLAEWCCSAAGEELADDLSVISRAEKYFDKNKGG